MKKKRFYQMGFGAVLLLLTSCSNSYPSIQGHYAPDARQFGTLSVDDYTTAPWDFTMASRLDASPDEVWKVLGDTPSLSKWFPGASDCQVLPERSQDVSYEILYTRQCNFIGAQLTEDIVFDNQKDMLAYRFNRERTTMPVPMENIMGVFHVSPYQGGSIATWRLYWDKGFLGTFFAPMMRTFFMEKGMDSLVQVFGGERVTIQNSNPSKESL